MGVDNLEQGRGQPFYFVLVDGRDQTPERRDVRYVPQELLDSVEMATDEFEHTHKDRLFAGFDRNRGIYLLQSTATKKKDEEAGAQGG